MSYDGQFGHCPKSDYGHDQNHTDPDLSPCIHCGQMVIFMPGENTMRLHEYVIEEEPV